MPDTAVLCYPDGGRVDVTLHRDDDGNLVLSVPSAACASGMVVRLPSGVTLAIAVAGEPGSTASGHIGGT